MTKLEAINEMLSVINEQPVNTLDEGYVEANLANTILENVSTEIQSNRSWWFNSETEYTISPTIDNYIILPDNCLKVDGSSYTDNYVKRGNKLYNREDKTYTFTDTVEVDITFKLDFEDLPFTAQNYIVMRSARKFQSRILGSQTLFAYTEKEEEEARIQLVSEDNDNNDYNLLDNTNNISLY